MENRKFTVVDELAERYLDSLHAGEHLDMDETLKQLPPELQKAGRERLQLVKMLYDAREFNQEVR